MDVVRQHIQKNLANLNGRSDPAFEIIFDALKSPKKLELKLFLKYLNDIVLYPKHITSEGVQFLHIHLPVVDHDVLSAILEWLIVHQFHTHFKNPTNFSSDDPCFIDKNILELGNSINSPAIPPDASAKNGGNKIYKQYQEKKNRLRELKAFYQRLASNKTGSYSEFFPSTLINVLHKEQEIQLRNFFGQNHYCILSNEITDPKKRSYVLLNDSLRISDIESLKLNGNSVLNSIETVVLFDCISQAKFSEYNYRNILEYNKEGFKLKKLIAFSSEKAKLSLSGLISKLTSINSRLYIRPIGLSFNSYLIHPYEITPVDRSPELTFLGDSSVFCYEFCELIQDTPELKELYSIKLRNIYSLSWNSHITKYILDDIFDPNIESALISKTTKETLLQQSFMSTAKDLLSSILHIVESFGQRYIEQCLRTTNVVVIIPHSVLNNRQLLTLISSAIGKKVQFNSWKAIKDYTLQHEDLIILDYRDCGDFPFNITPNLYEIEHLLTNRVLGIFLAMFFKNTSEYTLYRYRVTFFKQVMGHPFRYDNLEWKMLKNEIEKTRPQDDDIQTLWDLENSYEREYDHTSIEFTYERNQKRKFYPSQLLIFSEDLNIKHVDTAENLYESYKGKKLYVQPLEKSYEGIHLFEFTNEETEELTEIQNKYELNSTEKSSELWKVFLLRRSAEKNWAEVFNEIEKIANDNNINFISKHHFQNDWLDYGSETLIPRSKKLFKLICDYLELPQTYFRLMLKQRAKERLKARHSNSKMNTFLQSLINFGLFDPDIALSDTDASHKKFVKHLIEHQDLEDIGLVADNIHREIIAFVHLLKDNIKLEMVRTIKKINS